MIRLHAVVPRDSDPVHDGSLRRHDVGAVTVLYEETAEPPAGTRSAVVEHGLRLVALAERVPTLPMRYGTTLDDTAELRATADEHADAWSRRLAELAGRCELVVHVDVTNGPPVPGGGSGRAYLRRRMAELQRHDRAMQDARSVLRTWAEDVRQLPDRRRLAVLVRRRDADRARAAVLAWGRLQDDLGVAVTGPWPPFSFCEAPRDDRTG
jgi:hypothetical protein